jgi:hypothetical protein
VAFGYLASAGYSFGLVLMLAPCKYFLVKKKRKKKKVLEKIHLEGRSWPEYM